MHSGCCCPAADRPTLAGLRAGGVTALVLQLACKPHAVALRYHQPSRAWLVLDSQLQQPAELASYPAGGAVYKLTSVRDAPPGSVIVPPAFDAPGIHERRPRARCEPAVQYILTIFGPLSSVRNAHEGREWLAASPVPQLRTLATEALGIHTVHSQCMQLRASNEWVQAHLATPTRVRELYLRCTADGTQQQVHTPVGPAVR
jgi:hypothetical protein